MVRYDRLLNELCAYLPEYMAQRGLVVGSTGRRKIRCISPAHNDKSPSMSYYPKTKKLHCFGCGISYDLFDIIALDYPECDSFPRQVCKACDLFGRTFPADFGHSEERKTKVINKMEQIPKTQEKDAGQQDYTVFIEEAFTEAGVGGTYFEKRGVSSALCRKYRLFQREGRAYLPIYRNGRCVAYCARAIDNGVEPRYKNSPGVSAIFGGDQIANTGSGGNLVVTESVFDALAAESCGFPAVALCGVGNVRRFLTLCTEHFAAAGMYRFLIAGDNDDAGQRMNAELLKGLREMGLSCAEVEIPCGAKDLNEAFLSDQEALYSVLASTAESDRIDYNKQSAVSALEELFDSAQMRGIRSALSTGFAGLDQVLDGGFYSGLYVLGAISSLGKTSFVLQMADYIAGQGNDVLFFSLEMSRIELVAKSLSRISWELDVTAKHLEALSLREVLRMGAQISNYKCCSLLREAAKEYREIAGRLFLFEGIASIGTTEIREMVQRHIRLRGGRPVVIVDYFQILKPAEMRATDKQNTDRSIVELKRISRDCDIPVLAISSFNRENYRNAVSMEAFKESGAVEYSSDVLLGLQLAGVGTQGFDVDEAKKRAPRQAELVILKNRSGIPYARIPFDYYAKYSLFAEGKRT